MIAKLEAFGMGAAIGSLFVISLALMTEAYTEPPEPCPPNYATTGWTIPSTC